MGTNLPASKLSNSGWYVSTILNHTGDAINYALDYGNAFTFGGNVTNSVPYGPTIKPEEAWNIDTKLDDGKPASGKVIAMWWNNGCAAADDGTSANNDLAASYRLTDNSLQCVLYFRHAF